MGVSRDKVTIKFGDRLKHLWGRTRTIPDYNQFETYQEDIPDRYEADVYVLNSDGIPKTTYDVATGNLIYK